MSRKTDSITGSKFAVSRTAVYPVPVGVTRVPFNLKQYDRKNEFDAVTTHQFVAKQTGYYMFSANVGWLNPTSGTQFVMVSINNLAGGVIAIHTNAESGTADDQAICVSGCSYLRLGEGAEIRIINGGGAARVGSAYSYFYGYRIA